MIPMPPPTLPQPIAGPLRHALHAEALAAYLYEVAALLGYLPEEAPCWASAPITDKSRCRVAALDVLHTLKGDR